MKGKSLLIILLAGVGLPIFAYPIPPCPLRELVVESEIIIYADVIGIEAVDSDLWHESKAILVFKELLKGKVHNDTLEVYFSPSMVCPSPAYYEIGTTVLAFLDNSKRAYRTHALSYGSKTLTQKDYAIYKSRILEMQIVSTIKNDAEKDEKTLAWLISCAKDPVTRWEGIYELNDKSEFMSYYNQAKDVYLQKHKLDGYQLTSLRSALLSSEELTYQDIGLIDLVAKDNDDELINFLGLKLNELESEASWLKEIIMGRIAQFSGRTDLIQIIRQVNELELFDQNRIEKINDFSKVFISKL